jgi:hypothetical protein
MEEVTREEFSQFAARASVVEREVEGQKLVMPKSRLLGGPRYAGSA